ncbi:hypothetical protein L248_1451 [Schleiferilactobacillus shenzhenensis LY-73]|uniref:HTH cro/C1-type domain-containing protein n=1 Tax=Schleiferilactobacillus shenzhenensis LY-73 TaxID=1231336 RepID=U4TQT2_9LACO|nr:hypothetical protein L248_1451 [Schleiferilactobacillus shenzhenensis LY-73]
MTRKEAVAVPYGALIRQIREAKHIRLADIADEQLSVALLSRFERGEADMTVTKFLHLLHRLHVTPDEFVHRAGKTDEPVRGPVGFFGHFNDFYLQPDTADTPASLQAALAQAQHLATETQTDYQREPSRWHLINWRGAQVHENVLRRYLALPTVPVDLHPVQDYLLNLDMWTAVDFQIYAYFLSHLDDEANRLIWHAAVKNTAMTQLTSDSAHIILAVGEAQFQSFIVHGRTNDAGDVLKTLAEMVRQQPLMPHQIHQLFNEGWYAYVTRPAGKSAAVQSMDQAISILTILHHPFEAKYYQQLKNKITHADPRPIIPDIWL